MNFDDFQQKSDYVAAVERLRNLSVWLKHPLGLLDDHPSDIRLATLAERIAELRNIEQVLVCIYEEREAALGKAHDS